MGFDTTKILPKKVCCCCLEFDLGIKLLLIPIIILRFAGMILGCFYGPYIYLVLPLGGLYLAIDCLVFYVLYFGGGGGGTSDKNPRKNYDSDEMAAKGCEFPAQRAWLITWLILDVPAVIGLSTAIGLFANLGFWSMTHDPIHICFFVLIIVLTVLLIYSFFIFFALYTYLKEAWLQMVVGGEEHSGLTFGGRRISI